MHIKRVFLPRTFRAFQLLYAARIFWWGLGGGVWKLSFVALYLNYLKTPLFSIIMIAIGTMGFIAAWRQWYCLSYLFHVTGVFLFGILTYSFFLNDPHSVAGVNYFMEMVGLMFLTVEIRRYPKQDEIIHKTVLNV